MKKATIIRVGLWSLCALLATGCQKKSGNMWDDNQTGAKYKHSEDNTSALWQTGSSKNDGLAGPIDEAFVGLNDEDLKTQFSEASVPQPSRGLGEKGVPGADQFDAPKGALASIFSPIFFETDQHTVKGQEYTAAIKKMAAHLKANPNTYVIIEGYCDERGAEAYNLALGTRRANNVRSLLIKQGVSPDQLHTISFGKEKPFAMGHNPDSWSQNRRAHFRVHAQR
jgi:peptidoglycan-associated lipoprotein